MGALQIKTVNLYIDVDGVILGRDPNNSQRTALAPNVREFIEFSLSHFVCYWLTTHCDGSSQSVIRYLRPYLDEGLCEAMKQIHPTCFKTFKVEVITGDFYWIDDCPLHTEREWLRRNGVENRWIEVNTRKRPDDLLKAMQRLAVT